MGLASPTRVWATALLLLLARVATSAAAPDESALMTPAKAGGGINGVGGGGGGAVPAPVSDIPLDVLSHPPPPSPPPAAASSASELVVGKLVMEKRVMEELLRDSDGESDWYGRVEQEEDKMGHLMGVESVRDQDAEKKEQRKQYLRAEEGGRDEREGEEKKEDTNEQYLAVEKDRAHQAEKEEKKEQYLAVAIPVGPATQHDAFQRMSWWPTKCSSVTRLYVDLVLFYDSDQHPGPTAMDALRAYGGHCVRDVKLVLGATYFRMFTDEGVRSQLATYDAIAVVDWDVVVLEESLLRLYSAAFDQSDNEPYWVKAADGRPLHQSEAEERRHTLLVENLEEKNPSILGDHPPGLLWTVNGKAIIYNNRDPELRRFFETDMAPWMHSHPFEVALWATLTSMHTTPSKTRAFMDHFVAANNLVVRAGVRSSDDRIDPAIFLEQGSTFGDWKVRVPAEALDAAASAATAAAAAATAASSAAASDPNFPSRWPRRQQQLGKQSQEQQQQQRRHDGLLPKQEEEAVNEKMSAFSDYNIVDNDDNNDNNNDDGYFLRKKKSLCVFVPAYARQLRFVKVSVESVLRFIPGVHVAIAADFEQFEEYKQSLGSLPGVSVSPSRDVEYSALNADVHCGAGTKQILYLEPGTLISRRVSWSDLYDQETGDLIVMYTAARRSDSRHARYACAAQRLLELNVPSFTFGTDLVLPVSANEDLRIILLNRAADGGEYRVEDGTEYDLEDDWEREFEYWPRDMERALAMVSGLEDIFLPQVLASVAYWMHRPGVTFRAPVLTRSQLKPRYGCEVYRAYEPALYPEEVSDWLPLLLADGGYDQAVNELASQLDLFADGMATCPSGFLRLASPTVSSSVYGSLASPVVPSSFYGGIEGSTVEAVSAATAAAAAAAAAAEASTAALMPGWPVEEETVAAAVM